MLHPALRFFARADGSADATLNVRVSFRTQRGVAKTIRLPAVIPSSEWAPTPALSFLDRNARLLKQVRGNIAVTISASGGDSEIDDVYIDPYKLN
jgi:hypothetical protein